MMKQHLRMHGQSWPVHFRNNWKLTVLAVRAAGYTLGHGLTPHVSGKRAAELHNDLWDLSRIMSIEDITYRLDAGLYVGGEEALEDFEAHAVLYNEVPRLQPLRAVVQEHFNNAVTACPAGSSVPS